MFYVQVLLIIVWFFLMSVVGIIMCLFRWGDLNLNRDFAHMVGWGGLRFSGTRLDVEGMENLESAQPCVYVANHQSDFDVFMFGHIFPSRTVVIAKKELGWLPFFNIYFIAAGNILIDRQKRSKAVAGLSKATQAIKEKKASIWIFPEGTRNKTGQGMLPFKKGAFHMAIDAQVPIIPLVAAPLSSIISLSDKKFHGGTVKIKILPPISTVGLGLSDVDRLAKETREKMLEALHGLSATRGVPGASTPKSYRPELSRAKEQDLQG